LVFGARGASSPRKGPSPPCSNCTAYNLTNLLSACGADTGHERKGDFHVKATPAASQSRTTQETSQVPVEASAGRGLRGFDSHSREPSALEKPVEKQVAAAPFALADAQLVIASEYGFASWSKLQSHVKTLEAASSTAEAVASLRDAAGKGDLARLNALLDAHPELIDERGGEGVRTPLHQAVFGNSEAAVSCCSSAAPIPTSAAKATTRIRSISPWRSIAFPSFVSWWNMGPIRRRRRLPRAGRDRLGDGLGLHQAQSRNRCVSAGARRETQYLFRGRHGRRRGDS
jgi:hypothetical protein